ncbi:MAG: phage portal protein [Rhodospirillales bacterium]|nr:phage portal protein [Rhodospirillales bacterium]
MSGRGGSAREGALVDASGAPIKAADIARVKVRAMLDGGGPGFGGAPGGDNGWGGQPWAYDAQAWSSQDFGEWFPYVRSPDAEINVDLDRVVARIRDLVRNDGWATGVIATIADAAVGANFSPQPEPNFAVLQRIDPRMDAAWAEEFAAAAEAEWDLWANDPGFWADGARLMTVTELMRLAFVHEIRDGDALAVMLWDADSVRPGAAHYATRLQLIDPDRMSNPDEMLDMARMRGGVEIDELGAPVAYWLRRAEPNGFFDAASSMIWDRFPRETGWGRPIVVHSCERERAGQHRGNGVLMSVVSRFKMLNRYDQVSLQRAVLQALIGVFVKSPYDAELVQNALGGEVSTYQELRKLDSQENPPMLLGGLRIPKLFPGESIDSIKSDSSMSEFENFEQAVLRSVAAATGTTAAEVSRDYSRTNYSSARAAMLSAWKTLIRRRRNFEGRFAAPVYAAWLEEAADRGRVPLPKGAPAFDAWRGAYARCEWIGPGRGWVDPVKERQGEMLALDGRFGSLKRVCAEVMGVSWRKILQQQAAEIAEMKRLGIPLPLWAGGATPAVKVARPL